MMMVWTPYWSRRQLHADGMNESLDKDLKKYQTDDLSQIACPALAVAVVSNLPAVHG
jgi:hypothetical protein